MEESYKDRTGNRFAEEPVMNRRRSKRTNVPMPIHTLAWGLHLSQPQNYHVSIKHRYEQTESGDSKWLKAILGMKLFRSKQWQWK